MSKDIKIKKADTSETLTGVSQIVTPEIGGGSCAWVWEDETQLAEVTATGNGTITAASAGVYGFSVAHVAVTLPLTETNANGTFSVDYDASGRARMTWERAT